MSDYGTREALVRWSTFILIEIHTHLSLSLPPPSSLSLLFLSPSLISHFSLLTPSLPSPFSLLNYTPPLFHLHTLLETSMMKSILSSHQGWVVSVCWSPSDHHQLLSASYDSTLRLWDIRSPKEPLYTINAHEGKVLCCDWTIPDVRGMHVVQSNLQIKDTLGTI